MLALCALLLTTGCSATKVMYQRLDWLAAWRLDDYLTLRADQRDAYDSAFHGLWRWHRQEELPRYAAELRDLAEGLEGPQPAARLDEFFERLRGYWENIVLRGVDQFCVLAPSLDEAQKQELLQNLNRRIEKDAEELAEETAEARRREGIKRLTAQMKRWLGSVTAQQRELIERYDGQFRSTAEGWLNYRRAWQVELERVLHSEPGDACRDYRELFVRRESLRSPALRADLEHNRVVSRRFLSEMLALMEDRQKRHAQRELRQLAEDFEELARRPAK